MKTQITLKSKSENKGDSAFIINTKNLVNGLNLSKLEKDYIKSEIDKKQTVIEINQYSRKIFILFNKNEKHDFELIEKYRKLGNKFYKALSKNKIEKITIENKTESEDFLLAVSEGIILSSYKFDKYLTKKEEYNLTKIELIGSKSLSVKINELKTICESVFITRDLVNEPLSYLTAVQLAEEAKKLGKECGFKVEVFNKKKIEALRMGGILAVNMGSIEPPTFTILEWKPEKAVNKKPIILVGKGVVFDTGGLSLKPTPDSMDYMKCDMSGAAAVIGTFYNISKLKIPVYCIGLIPATENRPDGNAVTPGDIIKIYDGTTVEVLNADAEGRLILADALSYAKKYEPELVFDIATLTGSAAAAIGHHGIVTMGNANRKYYDKLKKSGNNVFERIAEFPFWSEYSEDIKSDIADLKNIGGKYAGAITAGKFLEHFTSYPWLHLDIAAPAFLKADDSYRVKGGTGVCVRLFTDFLKNYY
ncbi:MAG: peptidase M17 [Bacteroidetes bacterium GWA2_30_7]|nr:MAG: peptidase M17 [Bacteroidetes bacterium GWA2_30_7]